jgi:hypothetical protein
LRRRIAKFLEQDNVKSSAMKLSNLLWGLFAPLIVASASDAAEFPNSVQISIQPVSTTSLPITPLATLKYNPLAGAVDVSDYAHPELSPETKLLRVGVYDASTKQWKSAISTTSTENFGRGIRPTIVLSLDVEGEVIGVAVKGSVIDAGQTREFGVRAKVVGMKMGRGPELNKPVVLSKEGTLEEPEVEKTLLQR